MSLLHLSLIPHVGPATILKMLAKTSFNKASLNKAGLSKTGLDELYRYGYSDFIHRFGLTEKESKLVIDGLKDKALLAREQELIETYKIQVITYLDPTYPKLLRHIYYPPMVLYVKQDSCTPLQDSPTLAVVGSRKADMYAHTCLKHIIPQLIEAGYTIVSGGALGADSIAHEQTMQCGGKTVAVFGSGLLTAYPRSNKDMFKRIVERGGTLVSPFPLKATPTKGNFPARNRIIAGLSHGCLVVQAAKKSGALITAQFALEQGRQVYAIPGSIHNKQSQGCHALIQEGAKLVTNANDILDEIATPIRATYSLTNATSVG